MIAATYKYNTPNKQIVCEKIKYIEDNLEDKPKDELTDE
jgi:hypothetical protein